MLNAEKAKNVTLFLGDGTGLPTINASSIHAHGKPQALFVQRMPHIGLSDTSTASNWVTDSAAGMTAIVTGQKTHNGVISQSAGAVRGKTDGAPLKTILEYAEERGLSTGVVSNSAITDATPAACYAHGNDRANWGAHFLQILTPRFGDGVDVVIGPGRKKIMEQAAALEPDAAGKFKQRGYLFLDSPANLDAAGAGTKRLVALFAGDEKEFDLEAATAKAVDILSKNSKGFLLMVESNNHFEDAKRSLDNMAKFDQIIGQTAKRLEKSKTLIVFTADHSYDLHLPKGVERGEDIVPAMKVEGHHNAEEVLVSAMGPGAEQVRGFFPNTRLFEIMLKAFGWKH
jgi:alkaline phosphatase